MQKTTHTEKIHRSDAGIALRRSPEYAINAVLSARMLHA